MYFSGPNRCGMYREASRHYLGVAITWLIAIGVLAVGVLHAQAPNAGTTPGMLKGRAVNGTTGQPVANVSVEYVQLSQGMVPVEIVRTDAAGNFQFSKVPVPGNTPGPPGLLRIEHQGATYSQPVMGGGQAGQPGMPPGMATGDNVTVTIYDSSSDRDLFVVHEHAIFVRPSGSTMTVLEQVFIENTSAPPRAYVNANGTFRFTLPAKPRGEVSVSLQGAAGMPLPQTPRPDATVPNTYTIDYPIRPGESIIRVNYQLDYQQPYDFSKPLDRLPEQVHVVTPGDNVKIESENMIPAGKDDASGFSAYLLQPVGNVVNFRVSGEAPPDQVSATQDQEGGLTPIPNPLHEYRWPLFGGLGAVLLAGFVYLYKKG